MPYANQWIMSLNVDAHVLRYIWFLTKHAKVKMAGYWPCSFLHVFGLRQSQGSETHTKKERG